MPLATEQARSGNMVLHGASHGKSQATPCNDHPHEADGSTDVETHHIGEDCWGKGKRKGKPYGRSGTSIRQALEEFSQRGFHGKVALREALALI